MGFQVEWVRVLAYCGGGKKADRPQPQGSITVREDGALAISVDDDYYDGEIAPAEARRLCEEILRAQRLAVVSLGELDSLRAAGARLVLGRPEEAQEDEV